jgi:hypothetical protein
MNKEEKHKEKIAVGHKCAFCGSYRLTTLKGDINTPLKDIIVECDECKRIVRFPDLGIVYLEVE